MSWSTTDIPALRGMVAVVTGANGGLGLATAKALAAKGAHVVMAVRNLDKAQRAHEEILAAAPEASLEMVSLDLSSQGSVREAAAMVHDRHDRVDMLINNAGVMAIPQGRTEDGFESQLATNHLGHWTWTAMLLPAVLRADAGRIVALTSIARFQGGPLDPKNPFLDGTYSAWAAYGNSKLANLHFAMGLDQRLRAAGSQAIALAAHPGLTNSDLQSTTRHAGGGGVMGELSEGLTRLTGMSIDRGALSQLRAATDPRAEGGMLYGPAFGTFGPPVRKPTLSRDTDRAIESLWSISAELTGVDVDVMGPPSPA